MAGELAARTPRMVAPRRLVRHGCRSRSRARTFAITNWWAPNPITRFDLDLTRDLAHGRTPTGNDLARWGATISETPVKIGVTAVIVLVMLRRWRRWYEPLFVALPLIFEASAFMAITLIVGRRNLRFPTWLARPSDPASRRATLPRRRSTSRWRSSCTATRDRPRCGSSPSRRQSRRPSSWGGRGCIKACTTSATSSPA